MLAPSVVASVFGGSVGAPELGAGSVAVQSIVTLPLYQPSAFAGRSGVPVTIGGTVSVRSPKFQWLAAEVRTVSCASPSAKDSRLEMHGSGDAVPGAPAQTITNAPFLKT